MTDLKPELLTDALRDATRHFLERTGRNADDARAELDRFLDEMRPDIEALIAEAAAGHSAATEALELIADAAVARAVRLALVFTAQERAAFGAMLLISIKTALAVVLAAV